MLGRLLFLCGVVALCSATYRANAAGAPTITTQPASQTVIVGGTATFQVVATGTPSPTYQWRKNGTNISGATATSYSKANVQAADAGTYTVYVSNSKGNVTSNGAVLTVSSPTLPTISTQPQNQTVTVGQSFSFNVVANGTPAPTYQWRKGGIDIAGATSATFSKSSVLGDADTYSVKVSNSAGNVTSSAAMLTVNQVAAPYNLTASNITTTSLTLGWSSPGTGGLLGYNVSRNGNQIATVAATITSYNDLNLVPNTAYTYRVVGFNSSGYTDFSAPLTVTTAAATQPAPVITSATTAGAQVGVAFTYQIVTTNSPASYAASGLPLGLSVNTSTGLVSGTPTRAGTSSVVISATNTGGTGSATLVLTILASLPYTTDFESGEGYSIGSLAGQVGWAVSQGTALVTSSDHFSGTNSALLPASSPTAILTQTFAPAVGAGVVYVDFFAKPVAELSAAQATSFTAERATFAFQRSGSQGTLYAFSGDGAGGASWIPTSFSLVLGADNRPVTWTRLTARTDFVRQAWDLYANGQMVAADLKFFSSGATYLSTFRMQGDSTTASGLDDVYVEPTSPLVPDTNNNGIDDDWETAHGLLLTNENRNLSPSGSGVTVVQAYVQGTDPNDYYNGTTPTLAMLAGNNQVTAPDQFNPLAFDVGVWNSAGTAPLVNAPVTFTVQSGGGKLALTNTGTPALSNILNLATDMDGTARVYYKQPLSANTASQIAVTAGTVSPLTFQTQNSGQSNYDSDGNGIPDWWELQYFGHIGVVPGADTDGDGVSNLLEFLLGRNPTKAAITDTAGAVNLRVYSPNR